MHIKEIGAKSEQFGTLLSGASIFHGKEMTLVPQVRFHIYGDARGNNLSYGRCI
jgi:hypothetical protein